ncbi:MAG: undecaprenyl-diphosphatase [Halobacteriales archaeon]|jgi:undecaprenyl-diphosphatase
MDQLFHEVVQFVVRIDALTVELVLALRSPLLTKAMNSVTGLGSASAALVFLGLFYLAEWRAEFRIALVALAISGLIVGSLMVAVRRPYPPKAVCMTGGAETVAHSFPSGHAAAVTVFAMLSRRSNRLPFGVVSAVALTIAVSRVYLGTHYLSDTVVGVLVGAGSFLAARRVLGAAGIGLEY